MRYSLSCLRTMPGTALGRISLALTGAEVNCEVPFCDARAVDCDDCPMLERGWGERRVVI